jgi:imidazolonepropionase-like amidohydrolase
MSIAASQRRTYGASRLARALGAVSALAATAALSAQDLGMKAPPQSGLTAVVGATVHPVSGPAIENGAVWFVDGVISGVGSAEDYTQFLSRVRLSVPPTTIDATGRHVWPGLIAPFSQLGLTEIQSVVATNDTSETGDLTPEVRAVTAVNPDSTLIPVTRSNGVLLAAVYPRGGTISGQVSVIRLEGWTNDDLTVLGSAGLSVRWPNTRPISAWWMDRSDEDQMRDIRLGQKAIKDAFDAAEAYARAKEGDPSHPTDLRWEAMRRVFPGDANATPSPLFIAANDVDQINAAVTFASERGMRCVLVGGQDAPRCADLLRKHDVPVIVMGTHRMPRRSDAPYDEPFTLPCVLHEAGLRFSIANNDDTAHERNLPYAAGMAVAHGLPHDEAMKCLTLTAAQILGIAEKYGSIESGKSATLIVTTGSPLEVTTAIEWAFIDGRMIDLSNKHTKLYEKYRERYRQTGDLREP